MAKKNMMKTPRSMIKNMLRGRGWLWSRERAYVIKRDKRTCQMCHKGKLKDGEFEIHHIFGSHMEEILDLVYKWLLCHPDKLILLCKDCHSGVHDKDREEMEQQLQLLLVKALKKIESEV